MVTTEYSPQELLNKAAHYCAQAEHCCQEVRQKVLQWGGDEAAIDTIIAYLKQNNFIDEQRYAVAFVKDKLRYQGWGRNKIEMMLRQKKVDSSIIHTALEQIDEDEYLGILNKVMASKKRTMKGETKENKIKLIRFLIQRGFLYDEIEEILGK